MTIKVAINGYGRIGRNILRALYESAHNEQVKIVAINDLADSQTTTHLTRFDSVHGRFNAEVSLEGARTFVCDTHLRKTVQTKTPPWAILNNLKTS